jgi:hypothetical protein
MAATGGACLKLHSNPDDCFTMEEKKIVKNLEESMGWGYDNDTKHIKYGDDQCIWPQYGLPMSGTEIVGRKCNAGKTDLKWKQIPLEGDQYQYRHEDSKRCMAIKNNKIVLQKCNAGSAKQHWSFGGIASKE